jgi:hypothetical protein
MHPLAGNWIANIAKSQRHPNHLFARASMRFEISGSAVRISYEGINASGQHEASSQMLLADAAPHGHPQAPGLFVISTLGPRTLESIAKKDDAVLGHGSYCVSESGEMMTATMLGIDGSGEAFEQVIVFDRAIVSDFQTPPNA